jgi:hypothetical protein
MRVPRVELAGTAGHPQYDERLLTFGSASLRRLRGEGRQQKRHAESRRDMEEIAAGVSPGQSPKGEAGIEIA